MKTQTIITQEYQDGWAKKVLESEIYKRKFEQAKKSHAKIVAASSKLKK